MIRLTLLALFACAFCCSCNLFSGGTDPEVERTRIEAREAVADAKHAKAELADVVEKLSRGEATMEDVQAAEKRYQDSLTKLDEKLKAAEAAVDEAARKGANLGGWGASIGGIFGPVGAAIGGVAGTIAAAFMAWRRGKSLRAVLTGIQAAREELHRTAPEALVKSDAAMKKMVPKEIQALIEVLKTKYNLRITG